MWLLPNILFFPKVFFGWVISSSLVPRGQSIFGSHLQISQSCLLLTSQQVAVFIPSCTCLFKVFQDLLELQQFQEISLGRWRINMKHLSLPESPEFQLFSGFGFCCAFSFSSLWLLLQNLVRSCFSFAHFTALSKSALTRG